MEMLEPTILWSETGIPANLKNSKAIERAEKACLHEFCLPMTKIIVQIMEEVGYPFRP